MRTTHTTQRATRARGAALMTKLRVMRTPMATVARIFSPTEEGAGNSGVIERGGIQVS